MKNTSSVSATNVTVTDSLSSITTFLSASEGKTPVSGVLTWTIGTLAAGAERSFLVSVNVPSGVADGTIVTNTASVNGVSAVDNTTIDDDDNRNEGRLDVSIADNRDPVIVPCEDEVEYDIRLRNTRSSSQSVDVIAELDDGMEFVSASDSGDDNGDEVRWDNVFVGGNDSET